MHDAAASGASLVEVRLDALQGPMPENWLSGRPVGVIATCRRKRDGGAFQGDEAERLSVLQAAVEAGVDWVDIEHDVESAPQRFEGARHLASFHDLKSTPKDLATIFERLCRRGADAVKVVTTAHTLQDNLRSLRLVGSVSRPTIAFSLGYNGLASRLLSLRRGAAWTYAGFGEGPPVAGQPRLRTLLDGFDAARIGPETGVYAVVGDPVAHSVGPLVHNRAFRHAGLDHVYLALRVAPVELAELLAVGRDLGIEGLSVTMPHKRAVVPLLDEADELVARLGVCNTVVHRGGRWHGHNTDAPAAVTALSEAIERDGRSLSLAEARVLVLGCGGVATAIAGGLVSTGAQVVVAARDRQRREKLAHHLGCRSVDWQQRQRVEHDILVNATSVGMAPGDQATDLGLWSLWSSPVVLDAVYRETTTSLTAHARGAGCPVVCGLDLFAGQAALQAGLFGGPGLSPATVRRWLETDRPSVRVEAA